MISAFFSRAGRRDVILGTADGEPGPHKIMLQKE